MRPFFPNVLILATLAGLSPQVVAAGSGDAGLIPKNVNLKTSGSWKAGVIRRAPDGKLVPCEAVADCRRRFRQTGRGDIR